MTWQVEISGSGRTIEVRPGEPVQILDRPNGPALCTAVAVDAWPPGLALIFNSANGIRLAGRAALCPLVCVDQGGAEVSIRHAEGAVTLRAACLPDQNNTARGVCCLCRATIDEGSRRWQCRPCGVACHLACIQGQRRCPACRTAIARKDARGRS